MMGHLTDFGIATLLRKFLLMFLDSI
uniref:Uncharacterized protein n=1 Tax=Solanum lycopersicum TaxID=4081 RepID=A0A3Q7GQZ0_SOLLC